MTEHTKEEKAFSSNSDSGFMTKGFCNWKKCGERFIDHQNSVIHKDYEDLLRLDKANQDEQFQEQLSLEKAKNCHLLLTILPNVQDIQR